MVCLHIFINVFFSLILTAEIYKIEQCPKLHSPYIPYNSRTIKEIQPSDIESISALGDGSIAAFGCKRNKPLHLDGLYFEDLGTSFFMGGDPGIPSIANFIRRYNPRLVGMSRGSSPIYFNEDIWWNPTEDMYSSSQNAFNAAFSGSTSGHLGKQLNYVREMYKKKRKDLMDKWKIIGILIGETDLCRYSCKSNTGAIGSVEYFSQMLEKALERIEMTFPRTLVVLHLLPEMSLLEWYVSLHPRCQSKMQLSYNICPCAFTDPEKLKDTRDEFNDSIIKIAEKFNEKGSDTFGVSVVHILKDTVNRGDCVNDRSIYTSKDDCFHPSSDAHKEMAKAVWNSLFVENSDRKSNIGLSDNLFCPDKDSCFKL